MFRSTKQRDQAIELELLFAKNRDQRRVLDALERYRVDFALQELRIEVDRAINEARSPLESPRREFAKRFFGVRGGDEVEIAERVAGMSQPPIDVARGFEHAAPCKSLRVGRSGSGKPPRESHEGLTESPVQLLLQLGHHQRKRHGAVSTSIDRLDLEQYLVHVWNGWHE